MTWFSRVLINPNLRQGRRLITNAHVMHAAVLACFPPDVAANGRVLWRLDEQHPRYTLYIVSPARPDLRPLSEQAGWSTEPGQILDYGPLLDRVELGTTWRFRLRANPVRSVSAGRGRRGRIVPHVTPEQQLGWLAERAGRHGFALVERDGTSLAAVTGRADRHFVKNDRHTGGRRAVTLREAQFDGVLECTDRQLLRQTLTQGIGRGKAYGCGLLTIARV